MLARLLLRETEMAARLRPTKPFLGERAFRMPRRRGAVIEHLDDKPGMGAAFWRQQKAISEKRMAIIDEAPREWRDLVNDFDPDLVADLAGQGVGVASARAALEHHFGRQDVRYF